MLAAHSARGLGNAGTACFGNFHRTLIMPAKAGIHAAPRLDAGFRRHDTPVSIGL